MRDDSPLLLAYLARRADLVRHFRARLGSEAAAQDIVQDIYLKIQRTPVEEINNPVAYLYRLGTNLMLDSIKQQARSRRRDAEWRSATVSAVGDQDINEAPAADVDLAARQRLDRTVQAVNQLSPAVREAFRLHKLEGLSHAETAAAMRISRSSVEKHIMASLKHILTRVGP